MRIASRNVVAASGTEIKHVSFFPALAASVSQQELGAQLALAPITGVVFTSYVFFSSALTICL